MEGKFVAKGLILSQKGLDFANAKIDTYDEIVKCKTCSKKEERKNIDGL